MCFLVASFHEQPGTHGLKGHERCGSRANTSEITTSGLPAHPVHLPGGSQKKDVDEANKDLFPKCSLKFRVLKLRFLACSGGPGGFREVREAGRNHFHLSWYLIGPGVTSYDQKPSRIRNEQN